MQYVPWLFDTADLNREFATPTKAKPKPPKPKRTEAKENKKVKMQDKGINNEI